MNIFRKKVIGVDVERTSSTIWNGLRWTVIVRYQKCLFGFLKWEDMCLVSDPFDNKQDAKRVAKHLRNKYNLK